MNSTDKLACFIHSTNMEIHKTDTLDYLLQYLKERDIFDKLDFILINNIGTELDETYYKRIHKKIIVVNYSTDINLFECVTIKQLITFSKLNSNYYILYLHTKGVSYRKDTIRHNNVVSWNNYMLYCLVDNLKNCVNLLKYYDTVGCNFRKDYKAHYSGNFWWAKSSYLERLKLTDFNQKFDAEFCILTQQPNYFNIHCLHHMYETHYLLDNYKISIQEGFKKQDNNIYYCKLGWIGIGLTHQLYSLISCIFKCIHLNNFEKIIVLDDFLTDINTNIYKSVDDIFDLESINMYLNKYNIFLLSKHNIKLNITSILYGLESNKFDITQIIRDLYCTSNSLYVSSKTDLNNLFGDPFKEVKKNIYVTYKLNQCDYTIYDTFIENENIIINFNNFDNVHWHKQNCIRKELEINDALITELLANIHFKERFNIISDKFVNSITVIPEQAINVIHLRNEEDAIIFWGQINNMDYNTYKNTLEDKYIYLIQKYIHKNSINIILSANTSNKVLDFMQQHDFYYVIYNKTIENGREESAIIDLFNSKHCNSMFIGNTNIITLNGSTFSYLLYKRLEDKAGVTKILIDLDHINALEELY